jgi:hypothetical protein
MGKHRTNGATLYTEILNDPEAARKKYQLYCANCNWIKRAEKKEMRSRGYRKRLERENTPNKKVDLFRQLQAVLTRKQAEQSLS